MSVVHSKDASSWSYYEPIETLSTQIELNGI